MNRSMLFLSTAAALAITTLPSCRQVTAVEPPNILYGQEECARCRMIISEERFASAIVFEHADGELESAAFDDFNCLFEHEQSLGGAAVVARYVHDYDTLQWLNLSDAVFVHAESLHTPMASGFAAFATRDGALAKLASHEDGQVLSGAAVCDYFMARPVENELADALSGKERHQ